MVHFHKHIRHHNIRRGRSHQNRNVGHDSHDGHGDGGHDHRNGHRGRHKQLELGQHRRRVGCEDCGCDVRGHRNDRHDIKHMDR